MTTKKTSIEPSIPYEEVLHASLKNWEVTEEYLRLSLEGGLDEFLEALRDVAKAHGMSSLARKSGLSRPALYKILSPKGNPHAKNLWQLMRALGMRFELAMNKEETK